MLFAALIDVPANVGYTAIFALIAIETMGIPVPAEAALIAAALLARKGQLDIVTLVLVAAAAAIVGDNVGFAIGRQFGRRIFLAKGPFEKHRLKVLEYGEPFFEKHGPKAVFLGRWISGLRIASAWLAGMNKMRWPTFLFWNALGGICWAASVALAIYWLGGFAESALKVVGPVGVGVFVLLVIGLLIYRRRRVVEARRMSSGGEGE